MSRLPITGSDDNTWGDVLNDYLGVSHNADGTQKSLTEKSSIISDDYVVIEDSQASNATKKVKRSNTTVVTTNSQTDDYTLVLTDQDKVVDVSKSTAVTLTVPPNASAAFPIGAIIYIRRTGVGTLTIAQGSGVTVTGSAGVLTDPGQNVMMTLRKTGTNTWDLQNGGSGSWQSWTASPTGFSSLTNNITFFSNIGKTYFLNINIVGTSNATTFTFTLPVSAARNSNQISLVADNSSYVTGKVSFTAGSATATVYASVTGSSFTASGTKILQQYIVLEAQ